MYLSKYLPVNIKRRNAAVHTQDCIYPVELLCKARAALRDGVGLGTEVLLENGVVTFPEDQQHHWSIPDVYLACEAMDVAEDNNFSFYVVSNKQGIPQLFVSKVFRQSRLLVNAMSFRTVLVTDSKLVRRISSMIDRQFENSYCMNLFDVVDALENGATNYLDAIVVDRGGDDETMIVNPITTMYAEDNIYYSKEVLEEYRALLKNPESETEYVQIEDDMFARKNVTKQTPVSGKHAKSMVDLYDRLMAKKCNYTSLVGADYECYYYVSTNWRYLVHASTFKCVVVKNANLKRMLQSFVAHGTVPVSDLNLLWLVAVGEPE